METNLARSLIRFFVFLFAAIIFLLFMLRLFYKPPASPIFEFKQSEKKAEIQLPCATITCAEYADGKGA